MSAVSGCATAGAEDRIYHTLQIEVDKSVGLATNIRYTYGTELVDQYITERGWIGGPFENYTAPMLIPEKFNISWETLDGKKHEENIPLLSKLPGSVKNKTILFVIMNDHVEGFIAISTPYGPQKTRFY